jgi:hypothetical protein
MMTVSVSFVVYSFSTNQIKWEVTNIIGEVCAHAISFTQLFVIEVTDYQAKKVNGHVLCAKDNDFASISLMCWLDFRTVPMVE